ncbi:MAG TPA: thioredoxin domain-containing protein, partial [Anaeromyxobacteraceae bacterium]|nr:thioredoxin domain-containing protein [Anaeromyxobacteraceae bacterium]
MRTRTLFAVGLAAAVIACQSSRPSQKPAEADAQKLDPQAPVAKVGDKTITASELDAFTPPGADASLGKELKRLDEQYKQQVYQTRRAALEGMIRNRLLEEKAKAANLSVDEFLQKEIVAKVGEPSEEEMRTLYERAKSGPNAAQLPPYDQIKPDLGRFIQQQKAQGALAEYFDGLMKEAKVEILLPEYAPPKVEVAAEGPSKGPANAPVTIVEFSDFECPFCARAEETVKQVLAAYPEQVRLVYRDYPLPNHTQAPKAAEAAHCAGDQGKYWDMHGKLFGAGGKLEVSSLKGYAKELGLDAAKFDQCLDSGVKAAVVEG